MIFFIFGAGYSARTFARNTKAPIWGTTRSEDKFSSIQAAHISPLLFNNAIMTPSLVKALEKTTHLIISTAPDQNGDPVLKIPDLMDYLPKLEWIGYLSTVGVYGNHDGREIDETASCLAQLPRNQMRIRIEKEWQNLAALNDIPVAILRLAGIYGPGRNPFVKLHNHQAHQIIKQGQFFNRIHCDDIAGILSLFAKQKLTGIYNIADDEPAPPQDVISYAAQLMRISPPEAIPFEDKEALHKAGISPMAQSFYFDNKRILNKKLHETGYQLIYPDYRQALDDMWKKQNWAAFE